MLSLYYNAVFWLAVIIALNALVRRARAGLALTRQELAVIYVALCITSSMASLDCFQLQTVTLSHWKAHATPENQWAELFHGEVPLDLVVSDAAALKNLVEGGSSLYNPANYRPWLRPAFWWASYAAAVWLVTLCMASLYRRRWIEGERLQYPIIQVPLRMIDPNSRLWGDRAMWIAAAAVFAIEASNALHSVKPAFPKFPLKLMEAPSLNIGAALTDPPWNNIGLLAAALYPFAIGLAYLLPTNLVFSTVFFWWVYKAQFVVVAWLGWTKTEGPPYADEQMFGGYLAIGLMSVWLARRHLAKALRTALGRSGGYDDRDEPYPYRTQLVLLAVGLAYCMWFSVAKTRMAWWMAPCFYAVYFTLSLAVMRIRAEMGIPAHDLLVKGPVQSIPRIIGTQNLARWHKPTLVSFALHRFYNRGYRGHVAPHQVEAFRLAQSEGVDTRSLFGLMWALLPLGCLLAFWAATLALYSLGSDSKAAPNNIFYGNEPWAELVTRLKSPEGFNGRRLTAAGAGLTATLLMVAGHTKVTGWPVHPLGYPLGNCWAVHWLWAPLSIGWILKTVTLRYGGNAAYRRGSSIAIGAVLGDMLAGGMWDLIGLSTRREYLRIWT